MKRILNIILVWILLLSFVMPSYAQVASKTKDPYSGINAQEFDEKNINPNNKSYTLYSNRVAGMSGNDYLVYKNVNFTRIPEKFAIIAGVPKLGFDSVFEIRVDKIDGPLVGRVTINETVAFTTMGVTESLVQIADLKGVHDLYLICKQGTAHIESIKFYPQPTGIVKINTGSLTSFKDVINNQYEKAITVLTALGITSGYGEMFRPYNQVTRAEFTVFTTRMLGLSGIEKNGSGNLFKDVKQDYWASGSIEAAYMMGIINGLQKDYFGPNDPISYNQAVKMVVGALGYNDLANEKGGYPNGYLIVAAELGIIKNLKFSSDEDYQNLKRDVVAQLIYNSLDADVLIQKSFGDRVKYDRVKEDGILGAKSNLFKRNGVVTGTGLTRLTSDTTNISIDEVEIDGERYKIGKSSAMQYLGYKISYYYKIDEATDDKTILYSELYSNEQEEVIKGREINGFEGYQLKYTKEDSKEQKLSISSKTSIIYNGKAYTPESSNYNTLLNLHNVAILNRNSNQNPLPFAGTIKWVDNDQDGIGDVLFVNSALVYNMKDYAIKEGKLFDNYGKLPLNMDISSNEIELIIRKNGKDASFYEIMKGSILTVYQSINNGKRLYNIELSDSTIEGTLSEISDDKLVIDGEAYDISYEYSETAGRVLDIQSIKIGMQGTFMLDALGKIAGFKASNVAENSSNDVIKAGILMKYAVGTGINRNVSFKIFTQDSKAIICDSAKKVNLDGEIVEDSDVLKNRLDAVGNVQYSVIRFKLNSEGKLNFIDTYRRNRGTQDDSLNLLMPLNNSQRSITPQYLPYVRQGRCFGYNYYYGIMKNPLIFYVPHPNSSDIEDETNYQIIGLNDLVADKNYYFESYNYNQHLSVTDISELSNAADVLVIYCDQIITNKPFKDDYMIVDKITDIIDEKGNATKSVAGYFNNSLKSLTVHPDRVSIVQNTKTGDIIIPDFDIRNRVYDITTVFNVNNQNATNATRTSRNNTFIYGNFIENVDDMMKFRLANNTKRLFIYGGSQIYIYDANSRKISIGSEGDLMNTTDRMLVVINQYAAKMIYIIKQ